MSHAKRERRKPASLVAPLAAALAAASTHALMPEQVMQ